MESQVRDRTIKDLSTDHAQFVQTQCKKKHPRRAEEEAAK